MSTQTRTSSSKAHGKKTKNDKGAVKPPFKRDDNNNENAAVTATLKRQKRQREPADADILHGSFIVADLPTSMAAIYTRAVRHLLPEHQKQISEANIMEEAGDATLTFEVPNKAVAAAMYKRLQNAKMYGRRWKVQYYPLRVAQCAKEACLVDARLVPPAPRALALRALSGVQGFLTISDPEGDAAAVPSSHEAAVHNVTKDDDNDSNSNHAEKEGVEVSRSPSLFAAAAASSAGAPVDGDVVGHVVASFVDEGSALHARAVLSGRLIGTSGVRLFLELHR
ncbi:hypothetical protein DQ04_05181020 [Trypanosoma grayi]|uniref:hypothetical protein n=1 Tax=Trypanosoma grayi TaxID=71804 RepID=UPI0004F449E2|nr:hypothetical protein DQ04_05181020 [Trypanosoma grayi]KEG09461.1 hypothetical protein DQ04_05181020 [Trypanosoma grayi]